MRKRASVISVFLICVLLFVSGGCKSHSDASNENDSGKQITLIDFNGMTKKEIEEWLHSNGIDNVIFKIPENTESAFSYSIPDAGSRINKNSEVTIVFEKTSSSNIVVPDFSEASVSDIRSWANDNKLNIVFEFSPENDDAVKTNLEPGSHVSPGDTIVITVPGDEELESDINNEEIPDPNDQNTDTDSGNDENETEPL